MSENIDEENSVIDEMEYENYLQATFWTPRVYGTTFEQILTATGQIIGNQNILYFNGDDRTRVEVTVQNIKQVDMIVKHGLNIEGAWSKAYRLAEKPVLLSLNGVPPTMPNSLLCTALIPYGNCGPEDHRFVFAPCEDKSLKHIKSHRRKIWLRLKKECEIPTSIDVEYAGKNFEIKVSDGIPKCFRCGKTGHVSNVCRAPSKTQEFINQGNRAAPQHNTNDEELKTWRDVVRDGQKLYKDNMGKNETKQNANRQRQNNPANLDKDVTNEETAKNENKTEEKHNDKENKTLLKMHEERETEPGWKKPIKDPEKKNTNKKTDNKKENDQKKTTGQDEPKEDKTQKTNNPNDSKGPGDLPFFKPPMM